MNIGLLRTIEVAGEQFDLGSDFHQGLEGQRGLASHEAGKSLARDILTAQQSPTLLLPGDLFHSESEKNSQEALDVSVATNELLTLLRSSYERVLYVPGNHCLRRMERTDDPWDTIDPPEGVIMPRGSRPEVVQIGKSRVLLANIFYDGRFIAHHPTQGENLHELFASTNDGGYLLRGPESIEMYREMTMNTATALTPDIDLLLTHVPTHPSSVRWRTYGNGDGTVPEGFEGSVISDPDEDRVIAVHWGTTPEYVRKRINNKAVMIGSNVFSPELGACPKDGLVSAYGHHHRDEDRTCLLDGKNVRFVAHQRMQLKR